MRWYSVTEIRVALWPQANRPSRNRLAFIDNGLMGTTGWPVEAAAL